MKKNVCVVTGSRAEYGLFYPLLKALKKEKIFNLQIIATGMHLSKEFGFTYREIQNDGFDITKKVDIKLKEDTSADILNSMGTALSGLGSAFKEIKPDLVILLGDRFETFCAAVAAHVSGVVIAHLHGGELSAGAIDEAFRHAVTKMSQFHFTSTEAYRSRVIQLGENPSKVFNVGAIGIDNIKEISFMPKQQLEKELNFEFDENIVLVTFHPVTLEKNTAGQQFGELLKALQLFPELRIIFTLPNADTDGRAIIKMIREFVKENTERARVFSSLGRVRYLSLVKIIKAVIGNSSSGVIEVPSLGKPTINIGDRQKGRLMAESVINCKPECASIQRALHKALKPEFQCFCTKTKNPYGNGDTTRKIIAIMKNNINKLDSLKKMFYDLKIGE